MDTFSTDHSGHSALSLQSRNSSFVGVGVGFVNSDDEFTVMSVGCTALNVVIISHSQGI